MRNNNNRLLIAAAGSGKTTHIVDEALKMSGRVLITTYTIENEEEIKRRILDKKKFLPSNITVQTWFSLLIQHGVKPYQGTFNNVMFAHNIRGLHLFNGKSGAKLDSNGRQLYYNGHPMYWGENENFSKFYFNGKGQIYSDKLSKFVVNANNACNGEIINRLSRIYAHIYIDEIQDLAGFDLEIIKLLFKSSSATTLVGDPRQVTYLTHHESKYKKYADGKIKDFLQDHCKSLIAGNIDESSLSLSHRNDQQICDFSSKLYPNYVSSSACACVECRMEILGHKGVFFVKQQDVEAYLQAYNPTQLRWDSSVVVNPNFPVFNFGSSKGKTFERVLIYPTAEMAKWMKNNTSVLKSGTRAKLYVGITRARHSVGIVGNFNEPIDGVNVFMPKN